MQRGAKNEKKQIHNCTRADLQGISSQTDISNLPLLMTEILIFANIFSPAGHRGLKLDGAIGQGKICNSLKTENFSKSFLSHIGKNKIEF